MNLDAIANDDTIGDEDILPQVAVAADTCAWHHMAEVPHFTTTTDTRAVIYDCCLMYVYRVTHAAKLRKNDVVGRRVKRYDHSSTNRNLC